MFKFTFQYIQYFSYVTHCHAFRTHFLVHILRIVTHTNLAATCHMPRSSDLYGRADVGEVGEVGQARALSVGLERWSQCVPHQAVDSVDCHKVLPCCVLMFRSCVFIVKYIKEYFALEFAKIWSENKSQKPQVMLFAADSVRPRGYRIVSDCIPMAIYGNLWFKRCRSVT